MCGKQLSSIALCCALICGLAAVVPSGAEAKTAPLTLNKGYVMLYKGLSVDLDTNLPDAKDEKVKWSSNSPLVASVDDDGVVTGGQPGRCTLTATYGSRTASVLVETTYKKAYFAVQNAYKDMKTKIRYSLGGRMKKYGRDCSSFVARTYWDNKLGRKLTTIGPKRARGWALDAVSQARWLKRKGRTVATKKVAASALLPGDTLYTSHGRGGIDHASLYIGNGMLMDGTGEHGKGTVGTRVYKKYLTKHRVKFIGRPCAALMLDRATATLTVDAGKAHAVTLKTRYAAGKVTWTSSDPDVAKVNAKGKVTGRAPGTATVTATSKGKSYACLVTVS